MIKLPKDVSHFLSEMTKGWRRRRTRPVWEWMYDMHEQANQDMQGWVQTYKQKKNAHAKMQDYAMSNRHDKRAQDQLKEN